MTGGLGGISKRCSNAAVLAEKKICHITKDAVVAFRPPEGFSAAPLTEQLREVARELIAQAVEAELPAFLTSHADQTDCAARRRLVRHGHMPERDVQIGIIAVIRPLSGWIALIKSDLGRRDRAVVSVNGVRGFGSIYCLCYAGSHIEISNETQLWSLVALVVLLSAILHGFSVG